jgi:peptidoglycan-associated lipoprotein
MWFRMIILMLLFAVAGTCYAQKKAKKEKKVNTTVEVELEQVVAEPPISYSFNWLILDDESNQPLPNVVIELRLFEDKVFQCMTDSFGRAILQVNGLFSSDSIMSSPYKLSATKDCYFKKRDEFVITTNQTVYTDTLYMTYAVNKVMDLPTIWYAYGKWDLLVEAGRINSLDSLNYLYQIMIDNPTIIVEIQNHTDCRGKPQYSTRLSQKRAQACVDYLVSKGISKERLIARGFEGTVPRGPGLDCESINKMTSKEEQENAHQLNRRTQYMILSFDYKIDK